MSTPATVSLRSIPHALNWHVWPSAFAVKRGALTITSGPRTDLFIDPRGEVISTNSPLALFATEGDCILSARVNVPFVSTYDAGVLVAYVDKTHWAKLCFEFSPQGQPMIVSVVTKGESDDCNSAVIDGNAVYLRLARIGNAFAFHYSLDGAAKSWHMVRYFDLGSGTDARRGRIGLSSQSPTGAGCTATFDAIRFKSRTLSNIRSGL